MIYHRKENNFRIEQGECVFSGRREDPYGFWTVSGKRGKEDISLPGQYTSCDDAVKAVKQKLNDLGARDPENIVV